MIYIPGYDPIPPRRYRELYRKEGAAQGAISGYDLALRPREAGGTYGWSVQARIEGGEVEAEVDVLVWSDIVQSSMAQSIPATYLQLIRTLWIYISTGARRQPSRATGEGQLPQEHPHRIKRREQRRFIRWGCSWGSWPSPVSRDGWRRGLCFGSCASRGWTGLSLAGCRWAWA